MSREVGGGREGVNLRSDLNGESIILDSYQRCRDKEKKKRKEKARQGMHKNLMRGLPLAAFFLVLF